jgi:small subunit ribosomal protein S8e
MGITHHRSKRKVSGGRYKSFRRKKEYEKGNEPVMTKLGKRKAVVARTRGGSKKVKLLGSQLANVIDNKGKSKKVKVLNVLETPANRNYKVRNIITKSAIIETELGKARVTSRPGQQGTINAVLIESKSKK